MKQDIAAPQPDLPQGAPQRIAGPYACDQRGCRKPHKATETMWQHGRAFLCEECHLERVSDDPEAGPAMCVVCGDNEASEGKETCGNAAGKCAKALKRRNERERKQAEQG